MLSAGEISARELLQEHLARIDMINPVVNALVTMTPESALKQAAAADEAHARGGSLGLLHGLPVAHKDLALTAGIRTTFGSPIFTDFVPDTDSLVVERQRRAGAVTVGKPIPPSSGPDRTPSTRSSERRSTPMTSGGPAEGVAAARRLRWRPVCFHCATVPTSAARYGTPPRSVTSWDSVPPPAGCRRPLRKTPGSPFRSRVRWHAPWPMSPSTSEHWQARTGARRSRSRSHRTYSPVRSSAILRECGWRGRPMRVACRWIPLSEPLCPASPTSCRTSDAM